MAKEMACRNCRHITNGKVCDNCKSTDLSPDWSGIALIADHSTSKIASTLGIKNNGKFALKVT